MKIERPKSNQPLPENAKLVFKGKIFDVYQWEQEMYDGSKAVFEKLKRPDTAVVFPVLDNGNILIIDEEQPGGKSGLGAIGGRIEEGEDVVDAAKREMLEESGYEADRFVLWCAKQMSLKIDWVMYTFVAKGVKKVSDVSLDGGEKIKTKEISFEELVELIYRGDFSEKQIENEVLRAMIDKNKMADLKKLFDPNN